MDSLILLKFASFCRAEHMLHPFIDCAHKKRKQRKRVRGTRSLLSCGIHLHLDYVIATVAKGSLTPFINDNGRGCKCKCRRCTRTMVSFFLFFGNIIDMILIIAVIRQADRQCVGFSFSFWLVARHRKRLVPIVVSMKGAQRSIPLPVESVKKQGSRS